MTKDQKHQFVVPIHELDWRRTGKRQRAILGFLDDLCGDDTMVAWAIASQLRRAGFCGNGTAWVHKSLVPLVERGLVAKTPRGGWYLTLQGRDFCALNAAEVINGP